MNVGAVLEWTGYSRNSVRSAQLQLQFDDERCSLVLTSHTKTVLRDVDLLRHDKLLIWTSSDQHRNHLLIHVPREYDLVETITPASVAVDDSRRSRHEIDSFTCCPRVHISAWL